MVISMKLRAFLLPVLIALQVMANSVNVVAQSLPIKNIVLVHGAFVDGSGWKGVYDILVKNGYHVEVVQHSLTSFSADVAATETVLNRQTGPCILVGHSYGGAVITEAGNNPQVAGLVYIAAHAPDQGENEADLGKKTPPLYKSLQKMSNGFDMIAIDNFPSDFAADVEPGLAKFMAISQVPTADSAFHAVIQKAAWRTKPSWYLVAGADRIINPELERMYAKRAGSQKIEVAGASHSVFISHPDEAAQLIMAAAKGAIGTSK
jgi:pimeloyl-ACP methyl ester carboxylesterase